MREWRWGEISEQTSPCTQHITPKPPRCCRDSSSGTCAVPLCAGTRSTFRTMARDSGSNKKRHFCFFSCLPLPPLFFSCAAFPSLQQMQVSGSPSMGLRFERSNGNSLVVGRGQRPGGAGGEGKWGCSHWGSQGQGAKNPALCSATGTFSIQSVLSEAEGDDASGADATSQAGRGDLGGSHHPKAILSPMSDP